MRFSKVLLIYPAFYRYLDPFIPIGLGYISQALSEAGIDYDVIDMSLGYNLLTLKQKIGMFKPDLIGLSMMTIRYKRAYDLIDYIKKINPQAKIIVGGPHISTLRQRVLEECKSIDYGVVLHGEEIIVELCEGKEPEHIKGLIFRDNGKILFNDCKMPQKEFSFPKYEKFEFKKYWFAKEVPMPIISSRGCPFQCTFCISKVSGGNRYYGRSVNSVVEEIEYWYGQGRVVFDFLDDNFTLDNERVYAICDEIQKRGFNKLQFQCLNGVRADRVNRKLLARMKEVGFKRLAFGVESGSDRILKALKKGENISQIEGAIKDACKLGYEIILFFLVGSPYETWTDLNASFNLALRYPIYEARFYNLIPIPNTELFDWVRQNNLFIYAPQQYLNFSMVIDRKPVFVTPELSLVERKKALRYADRVAFKIKKRYYQRLLCNYGIFGKLASIIAASDFVRNRLIYISFIKKGLRLAKHLLIPKDKFV